jgi:TolB protein
MKQETLKRRTVRLAAAIAAALVALPATAGAEPATPQGSVAVSDAPTFDEIWLMTQDGAVQSNVTNTPGATTNAFEFDAAWSPDGTRILYTRAESGQDAEIWVVGADGSSPTQLTSNTASDGNAVFSPDGKTIAFFSDRSGTGGGQDNEIWTMNADGSNPVQLTSNQANDNGPDFSPDGQKIAFLSTRHHNGPLNRRDIFVMDVNGANPVQLTFNAPAAFTTGPHWSPDGTEIVYSAGPNGNEEIFKIPATGGSPTQLTSNNVSDRGPQWTKDGLKRIFFVSRRSGNQDRVFSMENTGLLVGGPFGTTLPGGGAASPAPQPAARCGKKKASGVATIVGTDASETLIGGPGPDVIAGFGGDDTIKGLGGKDRICGANGDDKLNGGSGNDKILGGRGDDKLNGGKGKKNICLGGKGENTGKNCDVEKKISG